MLSPGVTLSSCQDVKLHQLTSSMPWTSTTVFNVSLRPASFLGFLSQGSALSAGSNEDDSDVDEDEGDEPLLAIEKQAKILDRKRYS